MGLFNNKCEFRKRCKLYSDTSVTCNYNNGMYSDDRPASCKQEFLDNKKTIL